MPTISKRWKQMSQPALAMVIIFPTLSSVFHYTQQYFMRDILSQIFQNTSYVGFIWAFPNNFTLINALFNGTLTGLIITILSVSTIELLYVGKKSKDKNNPFRYQEYQISAIMIFIYFFSFLAVALTQYIHFIESYVDWGLELVFALIYGAAFLFHNLQEKRKKDRREYPLMGIENEGKIDLEKAAIFVQSLQMEQSALKEFLHAAIWGMVTVSASVFLMLWNWYASLPVNVTLHPEFDSVVGLAMVLFLYPMIGFLFLIGGALMYGIDDTYIVINELLYKPKESISPEKVLAKSNLRINPLDEKSVESKEKKDV